MQLKTSVLAPLAKTMACAIFVVAFVVQLQAADPSGKWSWAMPARGGGEPRKITLTLKADGEKLTGKVAFPGRQGGQATETDIENGKVSGADVSFSVTREFGGNKSTSKYSGKLEGDTIKGKIESERNGNAQSRDWEAKREK